MRIKTFLRAASDLLRFVLTHPANESKPISALTRVLYWQVVSRIVPKYVALPFLKSHYLLADRGLHAATGNWYCPLLEYDEMSFVRDHVCEGHQLLDVGANIGAYSIVAASSGAVAHAFEPVKETFNICNANVAINGLQDAITLYPLAIGSQKGKLRITVGKGSTNHVSMDVAETNIEIVNVDTLDNLAVVDRPTFLKIDVEGFEMHVLEGAKRLLSKENLWALMVETNGSGLHYGIADKDVNDFIIRQGFKPCRYNPREKKIIINTNLLHADGNTLYIRPNAIRKINSQEF